MFSSTEWNAIDFAEWDPEPDPDPDQWMSLALEDFSSLSDELAAEGPSEFDEISSGAVAAGPGSAAQESTAVSEALSSSTRHLVTVCYPPGQHEGDEKRYERCVRSHRYRRLP